MLYEEQNVVIMPLLISAYRAC